MINSSNFWIFQPLAEKKYEKKSYFLQNVFKISKILYFCKLKTDMEIITIKINKS